MLEWVRCNHVICVTRYATTASTSTLVVGRGKLTIIRRTATFQLTVVRWRIAAFASVERCTVVWPPQSLTQMALTRIAHGCGDEFSITRYHLPLLQQPGPHTHDAKWSNNSINSALNRVAWGSKSLRYTCTTVACRHQWRSQGLGIGVTSTFSG